MLVESSLVTKLTTGTFACGNIMKNGNFAPVRPVPNANHPSEDKLHILQCQVSGDLAPLTAYRTGSHYKYHLWVTNQVGITHGPLPIGYTGPPPAVLTRLASLFGGLSSSWWHFLGKDPDALVEQQKMDVVTYQEAVEHLIGLMDPPECRASYIHWFSDDHPQSGY